MKLTDIVATLLAAVVSARDFTLYENANFGGAYHREQRWDDDACCMCTFDNPCLVGSGGRNGT
jgi:hypothetical protein